jgi:hypothetical protein
MDDPPWLKAERVAADLISRDLKTLNNELSIWSVKDDRSDIDIVLLACIENQQRTIEANYVILDDSEIKACGVNFKQTQPKSKVKGASTKHFDIIELDHHSLAKIATLMKNKIQNCDESGTIVNHLTGDDIKDIIRNAANNKIIDLNECKNLAKHLQDG